MSCVAYTWVYRSNKSNRAVEQTAASNTVDLQSARFNLAIENSTVSDVDVLKETPSLLGVNTLQSHSSRLSTEIVVAVVFWTMVA
jgi:hypothetical protein